MNLKQRTKDLGYTSDHLAERWGKTRRRINQMLRDPDPIHEDAVNGLPNRRQASTRGTMEIPK